uniref:Transposase MuDR plant domain-containing protein n=1 Tax=Davidia involucrata TaxID=16924 RepID=A0A5B7C1H6_DAVIN
MLTQDSDAPIANSLGIVHHTLSPVLRENKNELTQDEPRHTEHIACTGMESILDATENVFGVENRKWFHYGMNDNSVVPNEVDDDDCGMEKLGNDNEMSKTGEPSVRLHEVDSSYMHYVNLGNEVVGSSLSLSHNLSVWDPMRNELAKGLIFKNKDLLQHAIKEYSIRSHHQYEVVESKTGVWVVRCKMHEECRCKWRLRAIKKKKHGLFEITKYDRPHSCLYPRMNLDHVQLDSKLIAAEIHGLVKVDPAMKIDLIVKQIQKKFQYKISYRKAWIAKQKAISMISISQA